MAFERVSFYEYQYDIWEYFCSAIRSHASLDLDCANCLGCDNIVNFVLARFCESFPKYFITYSK